MDQILNCAMYKDDCYIVTKNGEAYRIYFSSDPYPHMEKIPDSDAKEVKVWLERKFIKS